MKFWFENRKKNLPMRYLLAKNRFIAFSISALIICSGVIGLVVFSIATPMISTSYYHANVQFRAGDPESYYAIYRESLQHILEMYDAHPNWIWTLECQGLLIDMAYHEYPDIFDMIKAQNQRGQLELICSQYSHGLAVAYCYKDFAESIAYNKYLMEDVYGLTISNVIVLQEGQYLPAFPLIKHLGFDTIAISRDQLSYYNYFPHSPLVNYKFGGIEDCYVMPLIWLPAIECGMLHHQLALSDSERLNTNGDGPYEFNFDAGKMEQIELRHLELEKQGNIWMNMSDWVKYCVNKNQVGNMDRFLSENHWTPNRHQSVSRWMAWGSGESDDGLVHARNYYTRNLIQTAQIMNEQAFSQNLIAEPNYNLNRERLLNASIHLWCSQVTDTSGVNPNALEFEYMINNTRDAQQYCKLVIDDLRSQITDWQTIIQIDNYHRTVLNDTFYFMNYTLTNPTISKAQLLSKYGFALTIEYSAESLVAHNETYFNSSIVANIDGSLHYFEFETARFQFMGRRGKYINNTQPEIGTYSNNAQCNGQNTDQHMKFSDNFEEVYYSPSIAENYTQKLIRSDFTHPLFTDDYIVPLPICNGLLYNPIKQYAIITNNTIRHISVKWESNELDFYETEQEFNGEYEFIFFKGTLEEAHLLANIINPYPFWTLEAI